MTLPFPGKRKINLNRGKINFDTIHNKFYPRFSFRRLTIQCSSWYTEHVFWP